jgi:hypothetical protein
MTTESLRAFAARKGNAVSYWHKQKELGRLVMVDVGGKPMVDVERSDALIVATADPAKAHMASVNDGQRAMHRGNVTPPPLPQGDSYRSNTTDSKNATYMQAKTAREVYEAKNAQLEYEERTGKLVKLDAVKRTWIEAVSGMRNALLQMPSRLGPVLAAESDPAVVMAALEAEVRQVLESLSRDKQPEDV